MPLLQACRVALGASTVAVGVVGGAYKGLQSARGRAAKAIEEKAYDNRTKECRCIDDFLAGSGKAKVMEEK